MMNKKYSYYLKLIYLYCILIIKESILLTNESYIIFPLIKTNISYFNTLKNISDIINYIFYDPPIVEFNLGTPEQKCNAIVKPDDHIIYLTSYNHNITEIDKSSNLLKLKYSNINYFNDLNSISIEYNETKSQLYYACNIKKYKITYDNFKIMDNISNGNKLNFALASSVQYEEPGSIGLQLNNETSFLSFSKSFLFQLKNNGYINNYKWFIYYGEKDQQDYLIIGTSPREFIHPITGKKILPLDFDLDKDYFRIYDEIYNKKCQMKIRFNEIYITSNINKLDKDEGFEEKVNNKNCYLKVDIGVIVGTTEYENYLKNNFFKDYLLNNKCFIQNIRMRADLYPFTYRYFYCQDTLYKEMKKSFKSLVFKHIDFSENFILTFNDLFINRKGFLIFLVIFHNLENNYWNLGNIFMRKYQFAFDFGNKQIEYYHNRNKIEGIIDENDTNDKNSKHINEILKYIGIICLSVIIVFLLIFLGFILGKKIYKVRKKRANELVDNYEYKEEEIIEANNNIIN